MRWNAFWSVLGLSLLVVGTWQDDNEDPDTEAQKYYKVSISGTRIELTCPLDSDTIKWEKNDKELFGENDKQLTLSDFSEVEDSGYYACYTDTKKKNVYLYLKARVCENCVEADPTAVAIIMIADICITLGLLMVVYYWSKNRKAKAKPVTRGTGAGGRPRGKTIELGREIWPGPGWAATVQQIPNSSYSTFSVIPRPLQRGLPVQDHSSPSTLKKNSEKQC
ncbi:T-cell surface glycoprotein CD3 epsilon chain [Lemmus lemmus]